MNDFVGMSLTSPHLAPPKINRIKQTFFIDQIFPNNYCGWCVRGKRPGRFKIEVTAR